MRRFLIVLFIVLPSSVAWAKKVPSKFEVKCNSSAGEFELRFQSKSGDVTEDDMAVTLRQGEMETPLSMGPKWYETTGAIRDRKKLPGICRIEGSKDYEHDYPAFEISPSRVLIFFRVNGRPGFSRVSAVLYDPKAKKILDLQESIASIKETNMAFRAIPGGVEQRMIRHSLENTGCDCSESAIEEWIPIRVKGKKIQPGWRRW